MVSISDSVKQKFGWSVYRSRAGQKKKVTLETKAALPVFHFLVRLRGLHPFRQPFPPSTWVQLRSLGAAAAGPLRRERLGVKGGARGGGAKKLYPLSTQFDPPNRLVSRAVQGGGGGGAEKLYPLSNQFDPPNRLVSRAVQGEGGGPEKLYPLSTQFDPPNRLVSRVVQGERRGAKKVVAPFTSVWPTQQIALAWCLSLPYIWYVFPQGPISAPMP